ncbi:MAG: ABC transporter permease [Oscillospiraceae bacterium]|nr:ABC transporter permease [Oscillospiraceae bacterium]
MSKLLRANFTRLWKNKVFWGCMIFMFLDAFYTVLAQYLSFKRHDGEIEQYFYENIAFGQTVAVSIISAIFIGLFIGTEYSNGTMRNKLVIGHSRGVIYFANLAVCIAAMLLLHVVYVVTTLLSGLIMFGTFITQVGTFLGTLAVSLIIVTAYAAMFLPMSTLITSKSAGVTTVIMTSLILMILAMAINGALDAPEVFEAYTIIDASGEEYSEPEMKNPYYVSGLQRKIYEVLYDIVPTCQAARIQLDDMPENPAVIPLWSSAFIVVTTAVGTVLFRRKDLK